jgi:hypothetical protein
MTQITQIKRQLVNECRYFKEGLLVVVAVLVGSLVMCRVIKKCSYFALQTNTQ